MKTKIAINIGHKFVALEAEIINVLGIPCGIHKRINKSGYAVSALCAGLLLGKGKTKVEALAHANVRIAGAGADKVLELLAKQPAAPAVNELESYVPLVKQVDTVDRDAIIAAIAKAGDLDPEIVDRVICSRGKNKGRLLSTCPPVFGPKADEVAAAVWTGLQPNPFKISIGKLFFFTKPNQELVRRLSEIKWPAWLDADKASLVALGVW